MDKNNQTGKTELIVVYYALLAQTKALVIRTLLAEMAEHNKAIHFIQSKGLYGEFMNSLK